MNEPRGIPLAPVINRRVLVTNIVTLFSGSALSQGLTALVLLLLARQVGPEQYGQYASSIVLATFAALFFTLGLDVWLLREGGSRPDQIGALAGSVFGLKIGLGSLWLAALYFLAVYADPLGFSPVILRLALLIVWLDSLLTTFQALFKATLLNQITSILIVGSDLAWFLTTLALYLRGEMNIIVYMQVRVFVLIVSLLAAGVVSWSRFALQPSAAVLRRIRSDFLPYSISELLVLSLMRVDVLIVSLTLGKEAVGLYAPAVSLINAIYLIPSAVHGVMLPVLSRQFHQNTARAWRLARQMTLLQVVLGLGLNAGVLLFGPLLVSLLGPQYSRSLGVLQILSFNLAFRGVSFAMTSILIANGQQARRTLVQGAVVVVNVVFNLAVVYWSGIYGVAVVYVVAEMILAGGYTLLVWLYQRHPTR